MRQNCRLQSTSQSTGTVPRSIARAKRMRGEKGAEEAQAPEQEEEGEKEAPGESAE